VRALAAEFGLPPAVVAHRMMGRWQPTADDFARIVAPEDVRTDHAQPYPFFLAHPLEQAPAELGDPAGWLAEWKWDGIRAQLIRRVGETTLWSRGEELLNRQFPELVQAGRKLPEGTVIDGEILAWEGDRPLPFAALQKRIGRKHVTPTFWPEVPVVLLAFDLLERDGVDLRSRPTEQRRAALAEMVNGAPNELRLSPMVPFTSWEELVTAQGAARACGAEGLMLKRRAAPYGVGRPRGDWWKWKLAPHTIDAVLLYAQPGTGQRATRFTDYTFGVWQDQELVPIAKAYSGLTNEEIGRVDNFVRRNTLERHGPVRIVRPELVFELAFQGVQISTRHRAGLALRFPRMARWRQDKRPAEASTLADVRALLESARKP
jgi:DNA ligase-1